MPGGGCGMICRIHHLALPQDRHSSETWKLSRVRRRCCVCMFCTPSFAFFTQAFPGPRTKPRGGFRLFSGFGPPRARHATRKSHGPRQDRPRVSAEPGGLSHRFATVRGVRRGRGQTRFPFSASDPIAPRSNHVGLWVSAASGFSLLCPKSSRQVRKVRKVFHAAENAKDAETPPLRHLFSFTSHLSPSSRASFPPAFRAMVVESSSRQVVGGAASPPRPISSSISSRSATLLSAPEWRHLVQPQRGKETHTNANLRNLGRDCLLVVGKTTQTDTTER